MQAGGTDLKIYADVFVIVLRNQPTRVRTHWSSTAHPPNWSICRARWQRLGIEGFRLRPAVNATDLPIIVDEVVPTSAAGGPVPHRVPTNGETLRERLGLPVADNRYAKVEQT